jgi:hypothetical protein
MISMRRLRWRPPALLLSDTGSCSPSPAGIRFWAFMPACTRKRTTVSARAVDSSQLSL